MSVSLAEKPVQIYEEKQVSFSTSLTQALMRYFAALQEPPVNLYKTVIEEIELPLLKIVMERYRYNQSKAADVLGLSRGTLRTKLQYHFNDQYVGTRTGNERYAEMQEHNADE